jgi:hypothetical protein
VEVSVKCRLSLAYCSSRMEAYLCEAEKKKPALKNLTNARFWRKNEAQKIRVYTLWYMTKCSTRKISKKK